MMGASTNGSEVAQPVSSVILVEKIFARDTPEKGLSHHQAVGLMYIHYGLDFPSVEGQKLQFEKGQ